MLKKQKYARFLIAMLAIFMASSVIAAPEMLTQEVIRNGETITLQLTRQDLRGDHFELWVQNATGGYDIVTPVEERSYIGTVDEYPGAIASGVLQEDEVFLGAVYFDRGGTWWTHGTSVIQTRGLTQPSSYGMSYSVDPGHAGTTTYAFDVGVDVDNDYYSVRCGSDVDLTFERIEWSVALTRALYMQNALLRPYLGRVIIRADKSQDPYDAVSGGDYLNALKIHWNSNHTDADRDVVCGVTKSDVGGGLAWVGVIATINAYSVNDSSSNADFSIFWRHEMGHNWGLGHHDGGAPEGYTINSNNSFARMSGPEAEKVLDHRDAKLAYLDDEGTYTAVDIPPYAALDSGTIQLGVDPNITIDVMANDYDANGDSLDFDSFDAVSRLGSTVTLSVGTGPGGRDELTYEPQEGVDGLDSFLYTVIDSSGQLATGAVAVNVLMSYTSYEAEDADYSDATISTSSAGYTGTGYVIFDQDDAYVEWTVNSPAAAMYYLDFRHYSTLAGTAEIEVNGRMVNSSLAIPAVSGFSYTSQTLVLLNEGDNTIRLTVPTYAISTVDHLRLTDTWESTYEIADAYVRGGNFAGNNFGSEVDLWLKNDASAIHDRDAFLRFSYFDVFDPIDTATLRLIPTILGADADDMTIRVRLLDDSDDLWSEDAITWENRPLGIGNEILIDGEEFTIDEALDIDVTSLLGQSHNSNKIATFHIDVTSSAGSARYVAFGSKEDSAESRPQFLITTLETPAAPTFLRATRDARDDSVSLDWDDNAETDVTEYDIYRSTTSGSGYTSIYSGQTTSDYVDNTAINDTTYYYVVTAIDDSSNESDYSDEVSATPVETPAFNPTEDAFVRAGDYADTNYGDDISLFLKNDADALHDRDAFLLFSYTGGPDSIENATLQLFPRILGPDADDMMIRVRLLDDSDDSWSEDTITWNNRPSGIGNEILIDGDNFTIGQPLDIDVTSLLEQTHNSNKIATFHIDVTSSAGHYRYAAFGSKEGSSESWWPQLLIRPLSIPAAPTSLTATPGSSSVSLDWDNNTESDLAHYDIYRSTTSSSGYASIYSGRTTSDYVDDTVTNETTYYYVVTAVDAYSNESDYSIESAATAHASQIGPGGLTATASDQFDTSRIPPTVVDGSGITGLAHTSVSPSGLMWMGARDSNPHWFKVDLGTSYDVDKMVVYNFNWSGYVTRGSKNVQVYYSNSAADPGNPISNPGNWTAFGSAFNLTQAPGADDYGTTNAVKPDVVDFSGITARWVSLKINGDYGGNYGGLSEILFYEATPDTTAPTPHPAGFASAPAADSSSAISMTATTGNDTTGPVEYYFDETSGNPGATDSGWVTNPVYSDTGLDPDTQYTYTVQMRDSLNNTGTVSSGANATTYVEGDLTGNGFVNLQDFALFAMNWQVTDCGNCNGADLTGDGEANFADLLIMVENWLVP